jgi:hypothetical protein
MPSARNSSITELFKASPIRKRACSTDIGSMKTTHKLILSLTAAAVLTILGIGTALAANTAIGLAVANGSFQVDRAKVWGTSSLFEGSTVETGVAISQIQVSGIADVRLAADSRVKVYHSKMVLEQGFTEIRGAHGFTVEARSLTISPRTREGVTRIKLQNGRKVTVAALGGPVDVTNGGGMFVARVAAGASLDFEPQTTGAPPTTGQTGSTADTQSTAGTGQTGTGTTGATQGADSTSGATAAGTGSGTAGTAGAAGAGGAAAGTGIGVGTIAVIGGVAVAATVGGLAATGSLPGQSNSGPSASQGQ